MFSKTTRKPWDTPKNFHPCNRHHDLTILLKNAKKDICNSCFATLKKSYFNVVAGMLLEQQYLHNVVNGLIVQNQRAAKIFEEHKDIISNLAAEITEVKNNDKDKPTPTPEPADQAVPDPAAVPPAGTPPDTEKTNTEGHVAQATASLANFLHVKVKRVLERIKAAREEAQNRSKKV